jgi:hypothetical protein
MSVKEKNPVARADAIRKVARSTMHMELTPVVNSHRDARRRRCEVDLPVPLSLEHMDAVRQIRLWFSAHIDEDPCFGRSRRVHLIDRSVWATTKIGVSLLNEMPVAPRAGVRRRGTFRRRFVALVFGGEE